MRYAEPSLPPPVFTDPARRQKLASALPDIDAFLSAEVPKSKIPGFALGIVIDGELVFAKGFGVRDTTSSAPVTADTFFRIASMTKSFTAMAILQLRDAGKLSLDDPVERYIPELRALPYPTRDSAPITIRQLLTHAPGFPEDNPWADRQVAANDDFDRLVKRDGISFATSPGTEYEYSNLGYAMLGRIIETVAGTRFQDYVTANVLRPLGMTSTVCEEKDVPPGRLARGYRLEDGAYVAQPNPPDGSMSSAGCLYSSLNDMAKYAAFHLAAWPPRDDPDARPFRRSSVREMHAASRFVVFGVIQSLENRPRAGLSLGYGFGFQTRETCQFDRIVEHSGGLPGYSSYISLLPEYGVGYIWLASTPTGAPFGMMDEVMRKLTATGGLVKRAAAPAPALTAARETVNRLVAGWDEAAADSAFIPTFFDETPRAKLKSELEALRAAHGACRPEGAMDAWNALRGKWRLACDRGWIDFFVTLAPTVPPRIQRLTKEGTLPPSAALSSAANGLAGLVGRWDKAAAGKLFDKGVDLERMKKLFALTGEVRGACRLDRPVGGDGKRSARIRLACERFPVVLDFALAEKNEKVESVRFAPVDFRESKCDR
jgi:CubicO group peptidase (beta-lactamase class C family)